MNKINSFKQFSRLWIGFDLNYIFQLIFLLDSSLSIGQHEPGCALMNERFDICFIFNSFDSYNNFDNYNSFDNYNRLDRFDRSKRSK